MGRSLDAEVEAELNAARASGGSAAEERALQEVLLVEDVVDVNLGPQHGRAGNERISGAEVEDRTRIYFDAAVEIEKPGTVAAIAVSRTDTIRQPAAVSSRGAEVQAIDRVGPTRDDGQSLIVVEIEEALRRVLGKEAAADRATPIGVVQRGIEVAAERPVRPKLQHTFDSRDVHDIDVH